MSKKTFFPNYNQKEYFFKNHLFSNNTFFKVKKLKLNDLYAHTFSDEYKKLIKKEEEKKIKINFIINILYKLLVFFGLILLIYILLTIPQTIYVNNY